jgi:SAM-dependent methyltransferase
MSWRADQESHQVRVVAESFGADADRYDRTRPDYPEALIAAIATTSPRPRILDVGCGTGIVARQFQARDCDVLGVEVDERMAGLAREAGIEVEVAPFERWDPGRRMFDAVVSGQSWHWIDPAAGAAKAAEALKPGGQLALFWNVQQPPPAVAKGFADAYRRALPELPIYRPGLEAYGPIFTRATEGIRSADAFTDPERRQFTWERAYTREEWLELVPTFGGHSRLGGEKLDGLLSGIGAAIEAVGGSFTMEYATVLLLASRLGP